MKLGVVALHLVGKGALRATEGFRNLTIRNLRIVEAHLDNAVCVRVKLTETGNEVLQQIAVSVDIFYRRFAVRDVIAEGTVAIRERLVEGDSIGSVILTQIALTITFPKIMLRAHAATVILFPVANTPDLRVKGSVLFLCDRRECDFGGVLRVTKWIETLVVVIFL